MSEPRLDLLKFPDEIRVGLALVSAYMVVDAVQSPMLGGWTLLRRVGIDPQQWQAGLLQLVLLVAGAFFLVAWRLRTVRLRLGLQDVAVDERLSADASYLSRHIAGRKPRFMVTTNLSDANAFCLPLASGPLIVLGGGLRLLARKQRAQALAIVSHECAHVEAKDTWFVLATWALFRAYAALVLLEFVLLQAPFWWHVPDYLMNQGGTLRDLLRNTGSWIFRAGIAGAVSLVGLALVLSHFIRLREFRADERAWQFGLGEPLAAMLSRSVAAPPSALRRLMAFHPDPGARAHRLLSPDAAGRVDWAFLFGFALLAVRLQETFPSVDMQVDAGRLAGSDTRTVLGFLAQAMSGNPLIVLEMAVQASWTLMVVLHLYRVLAWRRSRGTSIGQALWLTLRVYATLLLGAFVGGLTSDRQLGVLADPEAAWTVLNALDAAFRNADAICFLSAFALPALALAVPRVLAAAPRTGLMHAWALGWRMLVGAFFVQLPLGVVWQFPAVWPDLRTDWLPYASTRFISDAPSNVENMCLMLGLLFAAGCAAQMVHRWRPRAARAVHGGWMRSPDPSPTSP